MENNIYTALIVKKLNNKISKTELEQLNNWLAESPENQALADKLQAKPKSKSNWLNSIIIVGTVLALFFLSRQYLEYRTKAEMIISTQDEIKTVDFVDGTRAILSPNTTIQFSNYFNEQGRFVELVKGEANISVVEEKGKFRVKTDRELITVLGETAFEVKFGESQTEIIVEEGEIIVRQNVTKTGQIDVNSINLITGETAISVVDSLYKTTN